jgi:hypothetical protein
MARRAEKADRTIADAWSKWLVQARDELLNHPRHGLLLVALDDGALELTDELAEVSFVRLDRFAAGSTEQTDALAFQVAASSLMLLRRKPVPEQPLACAPIELFVSHAKADLPVEQQGVSPGPVREILAWLAQGPVSGWYDAKRIEAGAAFPKTIRDGVAKCDAFVCVLTDNWSNREWCRRELLLAKRLGKPIVVVDALESTVTRLFSYIGNARAMRWQPNHPSTVGLAAVLEALRHAHTRLVLERHRREGDVVLGTLPEALTIRPVPPGTRCILYPDPPLPREELDELLPLSVLGADGNGIHEIELTTPLSRLTRWPRPKGADMIGLSLSGATDIRAWGASSEHLTTFADDLATLLLLAGLRLAYGGVLAHGGAALDRINYTTRLFGLVRSYSPRAAELGAARWHPIENFVPWPVHLGYGDAELAQYRTLAYLNRGPAPEGLPLAELNADDRGWFPSTSPVQQWSYAEGLSAMRQEMNQQIAARVTVAGKLEGFSGCIPGVIEEILLALGTSPGGEATAQAERRPIYLIGAFGGATRLVIEQLLPNPQREVPSHPTLLRECEQRERPFWTGASATAALRALGQQGTSALGNGLNEAENLELFFSTDVHRLVELILTGLGRCFGGCAPEPAGG